jgi:cytidylate kinase
MPTSQIPVITIDGPTASGKGTVAHRVADSSASITWTRARCTGALSALRRGTDLADEHALAKLAEHLQCSFQGGDIILSQENVSDAIRAEEVGNTASKMPLSRPCAMRWWGCSWAFARRRAWWRTAATWAR